jgi:hypothetical protein
MFTPIIDDELVRAEVGYLGAAALLAISLGLLYRHADARGPERREQPHQAGSAPAA